MTLAYFLKPFPKAEGFSAYRMPGLAVHVPVLILCVMAGVLLGRDSAWQPAAGADQVATGKTLLFALGPAP